MEGFAAAITVDPHRAADAMQDTWVDMLEERMLSDLAPEGWLRRVLRKLLRLGQRR